MRSIFVKELNSFFSSIVGYVAILVFLVACGLFIWVLPESTILRSDGYATLDSFFNWAPWFLMLLIPAVTMRSFADEFRSGTIEWLSTKPLTNTAIIGGKYLASLVLVAFALLPTLIYVYTIDNLSVIVMGKTVIHVIDGGGIAGSYFGLLFLAASFTAVGIFCSSLANNQIVGFLVALFACYLLYSGFDALSRIPAFAEGIDYYLSMIGMAFHYNSISRGLIDSRDVIYFLSVILLFISLTRLSLNSRRWDTATQD
ncbi:MAG: gliding motility-associated ABC transporter permease subunit GldF [Bacteroidetes bacterium]|nr:gliding motility-associated ABC transporter permease subunit GldF [Bacteroidota bacterium]